MNNIQLIPFMEMLLLAAGLLGITYVMFERQQDRRDRRDQAKFDRENAKERKEEQRKEEDAAKEEARFQLYRQERKKEEERIQRQAGGGSGGYIILDLPNTERAMFHDLLKGFEEYARLKGYSVAFSVDATFNSKIVFKFTLTDPDVVVSNDRVRKDLREYLDRVTKGDPLDDLPQIISLAEHQLLAATLRNRISFLQHSYNLAQNAVQYYEALMQQAKLQRFSPAPSVLVQTGGSYSAPSYAAVDSPQALLGSDNRSNAAIRIGVSYSERKAQLDAVAAVLRAAKADVPSADRDEVIRNVTNVKEELVRDSPDRSRLSTWLESAKNLIQTGGLSHETIEAFKQLVSMFGLG